MKFYLDTNAIIYAVEANGTFGEPVQRLFEMATRNGYTIVTSDITIAEILVKPTRDHNQPILDIYARLLADNGLVKRIPVDVEILLNAASLQAHYGIKLVDSVHMATARAVEATHFVSDDRRLTSVIANSLSVAELGEHLATLGIP